MKLTKYLARSGTIFCPKRRTVNIFLLLMWFIAACFWVALLGYVIGESLTTDLQFWLAEQW